MLAINGDKKMIHEINYPVPPVWYISYTPDLYNSYGYLSSDECLATGMELLETYLTEEEWHARLIKLGFITEEIIEIGENNEES